MQFEINGETTPPCADISFENQAEIGLFRDAILFQLFQASTEGQPQFNSDSDAIGHLAVYLSSEAQECDGVGYVPAEELNLAGNAITELIENGGLLGSGLSYDKTTIAGSLAAQLHAVSRLLEEETARIDEVVAETDIPDSLEGL